MSDNPLKTPWERSQESRSHKQERTFAKRRGVRPQVNSGRVWHSLRDTTMKFLIDRLLIDHKTTEVGSYTITEGDWDELHADANRTPPGCLPALQIDIRDLSLMVVSLGTWDMAMERIVQLEMELEDARSKAQ